MSQMSLLLFVLRKSLVTALPYVYAVVSCDSLTHGVTSFSKTDIKPVSQDLLYKASHYSLGEGLLLCWLYVLDHCLAA